MATLRPPRRMPTPPAPVPKVMKSPRLSRAVTELEATMNSSEAENWLQSRLSGLNSALSRLLLSSHMLSRKILELL